MKRIIILSISAILLLLLHPQAAHADGAAPASSASSAGTAQSATATPSLTTGLPTTTGFYPVNIQIENSPGARPQAGLSQADIVYECLMERGSVTRFQAVFNDSLPKNVGPVRSCRLYFVDIAMEYKGILAFFGGPTETVANIFPKIDKATKDGNLMFAASGLTRPYGKLYWRITGRRAPHNVYTNLTKTVQLYKTAPVSQSHFKFNANADYSAYEDMNTVEVRYTGNMTYDSKYVYDAATGLYKRYLAGKPFIDANTRKQIMTNNIIVQRAVTSNFGTKKGHLDITLIGYGKADVYVKGKHISATWERPTEKDITRYYDEKHNEIEIQPGKTWVQVVPAEWEPYIKDKTAFYSKWSADFNAKVTAPSVTAKAATYNSVRLTWPKAANATKYEVYIATANAGPYKLIATTAALNYLHRGAVTGTTYYYKVRAFHIVAGTKLCGDYSAVVQAAATPAIPAAVKAASASYTSVKLTWGAVAGATEYELYRAASKDGEYKLIAELATRVYTDKNLTTGTEYFYKLRAYRLAAGKKVYGDYSPVVSAKPTLATPGRPRAAKVSAASIKISWKAVAGAAQYEVWKAASAAGPFKLAGSTGSVFYTDTGLTKGTVYYYKVVAYKTVGESKVYGGYSVVVIVKP